MNPVDEILFIFEHSHLHAPETAIAQFCRLFAELSTTRPIRLKNAIIAAQTQHDLLVSKHPSLAGSAVVLEAAKNIKKMATCLETIDSNLKMIAIELQRLVLHKPEQLNVKTTMEFFVNNVIDMIVFTDNDNPLFINLFDLFCKTDEAIISHLCQNVKLEPECDSNDLRTLVGAFAECFRAKAVATKLELMVKEETASNDLNGTVTVTMQAHKLQNLHLKAVAAGH
jgi:hypothetical protein